MFWRSRKSESRWKDLPTELIRAVGRKIGFKPWERAKADALDNSNELSSDALYGLLLRYLDFWRGRVKKMPLELSLAAPRDLSVEMLANALVRIAILVKDCNKPAKDRRKPEHFARCPYCQLRLLGDLEIFLDSVVNHLGSKDDGSFYHRLALPLMMLLGEVPPPAPALAIIEVASPDPAMLDNFKVAFDREMAEAMKSGEGMSKEKFEKIVKRATALANVVTYGPRPDDPSTN